MSMIELRLLVEQLKQLQDQKAVAEDGLSEINKQIEALAKGKIPELMAAMELRNATFDNVGDLPRARVQLAEDIYASTRSGQKASAMEWLRDLGYEDMIDETYNASSLKALFRRMIKDGQPIDDAIFNVTPFVRASVVKA